MINLRRQINKKINNLELRLGREKLFSHPLHLDIVPTKLCNLQCVFCIPYKTGGAAEMSFKDYQILAEKLFPYAQMAHFISGGEPFLHKDFMKFLSLCRDYDLPARVSTNGMLLTKEICRELAANNFLKIFRFSFDGAQKKTVENLRKGIDYDRVTANMRLMSEFKKQYGRKDLTLLIKCAVMKRNIEELPELVKKAAQWGMDLLQVCYLNVANEMDPHESLFFSPESAQRIFKESVKTARSVKIRLELPELSTQTRRPKACRHPWQFIKIDPDGSVRFCYKAWNHPIGNIFSSEFFDLWNNPQYRRLRKTVNSRQPYFKYCQICSWRRGPALESSHIQNFCNDLYDFDQKVVNNYEPPR